MTVILVSDVARQVGRSFGDTDQILITNADIIDWVNEAQLELVKRTNCNIATVTAVASSYPIIMPAGSVGVTRILYGTVPLVEVDIGQLDALGVDLTIRQTSPMYYYFRDRKVNLYPLQPTADTTTVSTDYVQHPTTVTLVTDPLTTPDTYNPEIVKYVLAKAHERNENLTAYQQKMAEFQESANADADNEANHTQSYPVIRDDPWEDYG